MPRYSLALSVRVGCKIDGLCALAELFKSVYNILVILDRNVLRLKIVLYIDTKRALGEVTQVSHGGNDLIVVAQIFFNGLRLCR